jgi:uncharacterized protein
MAKGAEKTMNTDCLPLDELQAALPLWGWFAYLRQAGLPLSIDQYQDFCHCVWQGRVLTWQDLRSVSAILWVKPSPDDQQQATFDRAFEEYCSHQGPEPETPLIPETIVEPSFSSTPQGELIDPRPASTPKLPPLPRRPDYTRQVAGGVQSYSKAQPTVAGPWRFGLRRLPLTTSDLRESWQVLNRSLPQNLPQELDLTRTIAKTTSEGLVEELCWRQVPGQGGDLLVLVDSSENMLTYWPALDKLFEAIERRRISPAQIYRFSQVPGRYFYGWRPMEQRVLAERVRLSLGAERSTLLIVSDGGAAIGLPDERRVKKVQEFLRHWRPVARPILWLNPVPMERWAGTPAAGIQAAVGYRMLGPDHFSGASLRRLLASRRWLE